jgi:hypothetical protein
MAAYTKSTDFASKDALITGNPLKVVKGTELDDEFNNIQTSVNSKADTNSPALTGTPTTPTAATAVSTTQIASCEFVQNVATANLATAENGITITDNVISPTSGYNGYGVRTVSTSDPSGGNDGDIWYKV